MKRLLQLLLLIPVILVALSAYALWANQVPLSSTPGLLSRLSVYLTQNRAVIQPDATFPELRPRLYLTDADTLYRHLLDAVPSLGWSLQNADAAQHSLHAVVSTRWLRFQDDLYVQVMPMDDAHVSLAIHSSSRIGRGDFGANLGHVLRLYRAIEQRFPTRQ